jgi:hypothetical protein
MKPYHNDEFSNYLVESTSQFFDRYGKMYGENVEEAWKPIDAAKRKRMHDRANELHKKHPNDGRWEQQADMARLVPNKDPGPEHRARKKAIDPQWREFNRKSRKGGELHNAMGKPPGGADETKAPSLATKAKLALKKAFKKEDFEIYDVVLQYILDEGYAVSFQEAFGIMADLDEDTICDILEEVGYEYLD